MQPSDPGGTSAGAADTERSGSGGGDATRDRVQPTAEQLKARLQEQASPVAEQVQQTAARVADRAGEQATARAESQKDRAVDALAMLAQAIGQSGRELRSQGQPMLAGYVDRTAQTVERAATYLRARDVGQIVDDTERFARRNPTAFLGGGFALGLLAARFLKSSAPRPTGATGHPAAQSPYRMHPYATQNYGAPYGMGTSTAAPSAPTPATTPETPAVSTTSTAPPSGEGPSATAPVESERPPKDEDRPAGGASRAEIGVRPARRRRAPGTPSREPSSGQLE